MASASGQLLAGRYRTIKRLGSGGMATVLLAEDERLGRRVAVKRMHAESPEEVAKRFQREAQLGASLNHPNLTSIYDIETDRESVLIVMEYVPGGTLKDALARGPLPRDAAFKVLRGVAAALDYAHEHHVIHRDIKPANVLLDDDGRAKLADLGIATAAEVTSITSTGAVLGTASYMPPERLDGQPGGKAADIYGLATVAYETLTGRKARQGRSAVEIAAMVMSEPPPDLRVHVPDAPEEAARVLERGMARDPAERQASAGELVRELCEAFEGIDDEPEQTEALTDAGEGVRDTHRAAAAAPTHRRERAGRDGRRWVLPVAALVVALLAVGLVLALSGGDDSGSGGGSEPSSGERQSGGSSPADPTAETTRPEANGSTDSAPAQAVSDFYTRAANDDFEGAWELAGPGVRKQLGGFQGFRSTLDTLESIEFPTLEVQSESGSTATVRLKSVARHTNRTDNCEGTARVRSSGGTWKVERLNVDCTSG